MDRHHWQEPLDERIVHDDLMLDRGMYMRIQHGRRLLIFVRAGLVWLTQQGDRRDTLIEAGHWFRLDRDGLAVICALRGSHITITAPLDATPRWKIEGAPTAAMAAPRHPKRKGSPLRSVWAWWLRLHRSGRPRGLTALRVR
jgi:Protein of unknown function (DUF2917)